MGDVGVDNPPRLLLRDSPKKVFSCCGGDVAVFDMLLLSQGP